MKKGVLCVKIALLLVSAALMFSGCAKITDLLPGTGSGEETAAKNPYGFVSEFEESSGESEQLKNYPEIKEQLLNLEQIVLENDLRIKDVFFNGWGKDVTFNLEDGAGKIFLEFDKDDDSGEHYFYALYARIFEESEFVPAVSSLLSFISLSDEEAQLVMDMTVNDEVQTMDYVIFYNEGEEEQAPDFSEITSEEDIDKIMEEAQNAPKKPYFELEILYSPAQNERYTNLYKKQREERKPKAEGGINVDEYGLSFYVPEALNPNPYNGMLYVWEFYTGDYTSSGYPEGIDVTLNVRGLEEGVDADTYIRNNSRPANSSGVTPFEIKEINGADWYTCNNGLIYYYGAEYGGNVFEIEIRNGKVIDGVTLESVFDMLEKTLYFE